MENKTGTLIMKGIIFCLILLVPSYLPAQTVITIEAPSADPTLIVRGPEKAIHQINNPSWTKIDNSLFLFTFSYGRHIASDKSTYTAIQVDREFKVTAIVNGETGRGEKPVYKDKLNLSIPPGGFVLVASDDNYAEKGYKKFVAEHFRVGDVIKLRINGEVTSIERVIAVGDQTLQSGIELSDDFLITTVGNKQTINGRITNYDAKNRYKLLAVAEDRTIVIKHNGKGKFSSNLSLLPGTNYFDIQLWANGKEITTQSLIIYSKDANKQRSELVMWVEQFPNAKVLTSGEAVTDMVAKIKDAGFTSIGFDVKGPEGYVSYRKSDLSGSPYFTATRNPNKRMPDNGLDLLESVIREAHKAGLKVYASFNFFTEGNITVNDYAILKQYKDWEEIVQRPEDKGKLLKITESGRGKEAAQGKLLALAFVNPSNVEVQDFQLLRVEEVLKNYDIDGIILDRCRYDNLYADFSHVSRNAFEDYLVKENKTLENFPADAFQIDKNGAMVKGEYYKEWLTFRSETIARFTDRVRALVDSYKERKNPELKLAAYVGSWYEVYYQNGVNWAGDDFQYNDRLGFPESEIYGEAYNKTSYLKNIDFLMIGTYYKTAREVNRYITLGNILTNGQVPVLGSMSLPDLKEEEQGEVFKASIENSSGLMIFDYCYVDWSAFMKQMEIAFSKKKK
ncbi:MAG: family 10 glycosylhydrolase [Tannerellaceae bacterium]|jgi:uncharacterized lipoprotein YddW (UPF0748 family)|nr:family 10 glycosylhydrolase [Tannerellaceae bacterium]